MTKEELDNKIAQIERDAERQKKAAYREYVEQNAKYKVGDIVGDSCDLIRVETIGFAEFRASISIYYYGPLLTKKLAPRKDGTKRTVFEENVKHSLKGSSLIK